MKTAYILYLTVLLFYVLCCKSHSSDSGVIKSAGTENGGAYYIDALKGDDNNPATIRNPIKTITELNRRLQKRISHIYFESNQVFEGTLLLKDVSAIGISPVIISSLGEGRAVINGGNHEAIRTENCRGLLIKNLDIKGNGRKNGNISNGLSLIRTSNSRILSLKAEGFQKSGVELYDCRDMEVKDVLAVDNGFCGINIMGSAKNKSASIIIQDCKAENNPGDPSNLDNHSGNGILVGVSDSVLIDHCSATNNGWDMPRKGNGPVGIWTWQSNNVTIQYCISYRNKTSENAKDGGGFDLDGGVTNSVIQYCLSYENQGAGYGLFQYSGASGWSDNIIRYCVSINDATTTDGAGSLFIWNGSDDRDQLDKCLIYNNVVYNSKAPVISFENYSAHKNFKFCNNIFMGSGQVISGKNSGSLFAGNVWWKADRDIRFYEYDSLSEWAKHSGQEMIDGNIKGIQADPGLEGPFLTDISDPYQLNTLFGYTLRPDSPLRNKGLDLNAIFGIEVPTMDFYGNSVPQGINTEPGIFEMK